MASGPFRSPRLFAISFPIGCLGASRNSFQSRPLQLSTWLHEYRLWKTHTSSYGLNLGLQRLTISTALEKIHQRVVLHQPNAMISAGQGYTRSPFLPPFSSWTLYSGVSLISLCIFLAIHYIRHRHQQAQLEAHVEESGPWSPSFDMEKAMIKSNSSPSACDVLTPLSRNGNFPSSGAVAAMAREQMQNAGAGSSPSGPSKAEDPTRCEEIQASGSVQRRSESVHQMHEADANGMRTWKRLIVENN